jgi:uncharacterized protein YqeY
MSLTDLINSDLVSAMKSKDTVTLNVLRVLKGEIQRNEQTSKGKVDLSDDDVIKIVKKMIDNINETGESLGDVDVISKYLPQQMSESDIINKVIALIEINCYSSTRDMGKIMGYFSKNHSGQYDGKFLSEVVKSQLLEIENLG